MGQPTGELSIVFYHDGGQKTASLRTDYKKKITDAEPDSGPKPLLFSTPFRQLLDMHILLRKGDGNGVRGKGGVDAL